VVQKILVAVLADPEREERSLVVRAADGAVEVEVHT